MVEQDDAAGPLPDRPYSREELRAYLASVCQQCHATIAAVTDEQARQPVTFSRMRENEVVSYIELQLYSMRHTQEHAAQLSLVLGQHGVADEALDWVTRAKDDRGGSSSLTHR